MRYAAFTSMDEKYYQHCGKQMLQSYKKHWSPFFTLYVYNEDQFTVKVKTVESLGWHLGEEYVKFQRRHSNHRVKTFAKKAFSIIHAMDNIEAERLVWLDADTIIENEMPAQLWEFMTPDDVLSTHFSVWHEENGINYHSCETGFFILNKTHPGYKDFCDTYKDIYYNDKTERMRRFYDGEVYGLTVKLMEAKGYKMLNLNPGKHKTPISRSVIAPYITHFKAGLKDRVDFKNLISDDDF